MHCSRRTVAVTFDAFVGERPNSVCELDAIMFAISHHIAMGRQQYRADRMPI